MSHHPLQPRTGALCPVSLPFPQLPASNAAGLVCNWNTCLLSPPPLPMPRLHLFLESSSFDLTQLSAHLFLAQTSQLADPIPPAQTHFPRAQNTKVPPRVMQVSFVFMISRSPHSLSWKPTRQNLLFYRVIALPWPCQ